MDTQKWILVIVSITGVLVIPTVGFVFSIYSRLMKVETRLEALPEIKESVKEIPVLMTRLETLPEIKESMKEIPVLMTTVSTVETRMDGLSRMAEESLKPIPELKAIIKTLPCVLQKAG